MQEKVAVVTGGARGIGFFTAKNFLEKGVKVVIADINVTEGENAVRELSTKQGEGRVVFQRCDVTKKTNFEDLFKFAWSTYGRLDIVVNNAGILDESENGWESTVDVNIKGVVNGTRAAIKSMGKHYGKGGGTIVNLSSRLATFEHQPEMPVYSSTKSFVRHFSSLMGTPFQYDRTGVRVFSVCPGITDTPFFNDARGDDQIPNISDILSNKLRKLPWQQPTAVARGIVDLVEKAESGSSWIISYDEDPYEIVFEVHRVPRNPSHAT